MKILWLCNGPLGDVEAGGTGTWLGAMARGLLDSGGVELGIIASGPVRQFTRHDYRQVKQWLVPSGTTLGCDGLPAASLVQAILSAAKAFAPDLIHIWGTEVFWGLLTARRLMPYPTLLEMQGLKTQIAKVFCGGLTASEQFQAIGFKELIKLRTMHSARRAFAHWGLREEEIVRGHRFVGVQSAWMAAHVKAVNPNARRFAIDLALRQPFYDTDGWQPSGRPTLFSIAAYTAPFKGLHVAIRALSLLRLRIPDARLRIAGAHQRAGIRQDGYMRWLNRLIRQLALAEAIDWLGPLNAEQIVTELQSAVAFVLPTFIENCCTSMQEAMAIGTPVVGSYVGGLPSIGKDEDSCLFFPAGDAAMCAYQLERVLTDATLAQRLSQASRRVAASRNDRRRIVLRQLEIYQQVLTQDDTGNTDEW